MESKCSRKSMVFGSQRKLWVRCVHVLPAVCALQPPPSCCLSYNNKTQSPPFRCGERGARWLDISGKEKKEPWCSFPSSLPTRFPVPLAWRSLFLLPKHLVWTLLSFHFPPLVPRDLEITMASLILIWGSRFLRGSIWTCPFLNKGTAPWMASIWVCHACLFHWTLPSSNRTSAIQ